MYPSLICLLFFSATIISGVLSGQRKILHLNVDEVCKSGPDPWKCKSRDNCPTLRKAIEKGIWPDLCSPPEKEVLFCCPTENYISSIGQFNQSQPSAPLQSATKEDNRKGIEPLISAVTKAEKMCEEYTKYAYQVVELEPMIPGQEPKNVTLYENFMEPTIVGGVDAKPKEFPHVALFGYEGNRPKNITWICGGSLISPKFVLTAAHCISSNREKYWIRLGELDRLSEKENSKPVNIKVAKTIIHPQYKSTIMYHDIALLELETEAELDTYVRPICLQTSRKIEKDKLVASGWGHTRWGGRPSARLQKVTLSSVSNQLCNKTYNEDHQDQIPNGIVKDWMLCAGGKGHKDTCQGDSGGPLQIQHKKFANMHSIVGIISFGKGCALGYPSIYTRVSSYVPWIVNTVWP